MTNKISSQYFNYSSTHLDLEKIQKEVCQKTGFKIKKNLFTGKIYDNTKIGTMIFDGSWKNTPAILKIQLLKNNLEEPEMIKKFSAQNKSRIIRSPEVYLYHPWSENKKYGYYIFEKINAERLYPSGQLPSPENIREFVKVYADYHQNCLKKNFLPAPPEIKNPLVFVFTRLGHWTNVADNKNNLSPKIINPLEQFYRVAPSVLSSQKMQLMHGHFTLYDIHKTGSGHYILFSNAFWSYRPAYYDLAFHLWATYKDLRDLSLTFKDIQKNLQAFLKELQKLSFIKKDSHFKKQFHLMLAERCLGTLLIDLIAQHYQNNREKYLKHLEKIFYQLLEYSLKIAAS